MVLGEGVVTEGGLRSYGCSGLEQVCGIKDCSWDPRGLCWDQTPHREPGERRVLLDTVPGWAAENMPQEES